jgi:hypothetical protein
MLKPKNPWTLRKRWHAIRNRLSPRMHSRWLWLLYVPLIFIFVWFAADFGGNALFPAQAQYNFGASFSKKRAVALDLDWKANFTALLDDLQIRKYRLMSYWDEGEPKRGTFDYSALDWQMDEAAKRGAKVSLSIGLRQPRWPECFQPEWADTLKGNEWKQALYAYVETTVNRYKNHPALESFQLENEALTWWFGQCDAPDRERVVEEFAMVKKLTTKPVLMSLSDQYGYPLGVPTPDGFGYSVYRIVYDHTGPGYYIHFSTPLWYHKLRGAIISAIWHKPMFVHELQLEPWGPEDTKKLSLKEQDISMDYDQIHDNVRFASQIGFEDVYTWGSEWWYWRREKFGDHGVWEAVRREVVDSKNR